MLNPGEPIVPPQTPAVGRISARRRDRMSEGVAQLQVWLEDLVRNGLAEIERRPFSFWEDRAARLVDAQATGLAGRVRRCAAIVRAGAQWPQCLLAHLGRLSLLLEAYARLDALPAPLQDDVCQAIGVNLRHEAVVGRGIVVSDYWQLVGQRVDDDERVRTQRTWIIGERTGQVGVVVQFAVGAAGFAEPFAVGTRLAGDVVFWPGSVPHRAKFLDRKTAPAAIAQCPRCFADFAAMTHWVADSLGQNPFIESFPLALGEVRLGRGNGSWHVLDRNGAALPIVDAHCKWLLAASAGQPFAMLALWDGAALEPIGAFVASESRGACSAPPSTRFFSPADFGPQSAVVKTPAPPLGSLSMEFETLTQLALRGTAAGAKLPSWPGFAATLESETPGASQERRLLRQAGCLAVCAFAGQTVVDGIAATDPAGGESLRIASTRYASLLKPHLSESNSERSRVLLMEALSAAQAALVCLPNELLPMALDQRDPALRHALAPVLGAVGAWLARHRQEWMWGLQAGGNVESMTLDEVRDQFDEAKAHMRTELFERMRAIDALSALAMLKECWAKEKPEQRAALLAALRSRLSEADAPFLEKALADRSEKVRSKAVELLARLEGSSIANELAARTHLLFVVAPGSMRSVQVHWPDEGAIQWLEQWLQLPRGVRGGERGAWLARLVSLVDPLRWTASTALSASDFVAAVRTDWDDSIVHGLAAAALNFERADFAIAVGQRLAATDARGNDAVRATAEALQRLLDQMPIEAACRLAMDLADQRNSLVDWLSVCAWLKRPWTADLSNLFLDRLFERERPSSIAPEDWHAWLPALATAALWLAPATLERAAQSADWERSSDPRTAPWTQAAADFSHTIRWRKEAREELTG